MKTYADGLRDAARLLVSTAQDYERLQKQKEQEALKASSIFSNDKTVLLRVAGSYEEKARLMRGQAQQILELEKQQ